MLSTTLSCPPKYCPRVLRAGAIAAVTTGALQQRPSLLPLPFLPPLLLLLLLLLLLAGLFFEALSLHVP